MRLRILDLDGSVLSQETLVARHAAHIFRARPMGSYLRLACAWKTFRLFKHDLADFWNKVEQDDPPLTLYGSGDFHHVSLALVGLQRQPINLLVLDNHPDWMRGVPFLHCGTWLYHAARLPQVERVFHVGGDVDFDNYYRWMAPWKLVLSGKISVIPARRQFYGGGWKTTAHAPLRDRADEQLNPDRLSQMLKPFSAELAARPLYVSLDKDVLTEEDAIVNWDSGHLRLSEVQKVLDVFLNAARGRLAGMDITGDWSPVRVRGLLRHFMNWTEHPKLWVDQIEAGRRNQASNLSLIRTMDELLAEGRLQSMA